MAQAQEPNQSGEKSPSVRPYEVRIDGAKHGAFRDVRDAIAAARIKKREVPGSLVGVADVTTGQFLFEVRN